MNHFFSTLQIMVRRFGPAEKELDRLSSLSWVSTVMCQFHHITFQFLEADDCKDWCVQIDYDGNLLAHSASKSRHYEPESKQWPATYKLCAFPRSYGGYGSGVRTTLMYIYSLFQWRTVSNLVVVIRLVSSATFQAKRTDSQRHCDWSLFL